jgi:hypothetical protein
VRSSSTKLPYQPESKPRPRTARMTSGTIRARMNSIGSARPLATVCGTSTVMWKRCTEPLVAWLSMVRSGAHG